jgi:hypothetical protein
MNISRRLHGMLEGVCTKRSPAYCSPSHPRRYGRWWSFRVPSPPHAVAKVVCDLLRSLGSSRRLRAAARY